MCFLWIIGFSILQISDSKTVFNFINKTCDTQSPCVPKCCEKDMSLIGGYCSLNASDSDFAPQVYNEFTESFNSVVSVGLMNENLGKCPKLYQTFEFYLQESGEILSQNFYISQENFCLENLYQDNGTRVFIGILCTERVLDDRSFGMLISMPFLAITFIVYALLPDKNLYQNALMIYVLTLFLAYLQLVIINYITLLEGEGCTIIGYTTLFSFTTSFFWLNVICFDIWFTFSRGRSIVGGRRSSELKKLGFYSIYAFGVPLLLIGLIYLLQTNILDPSSIHNPKIGTGKCFLASGWPSLWYLYLEAGLIVIANLVFFSWTAISIRKVKKETAMLKHSDSKRHAYEKNQKKFNLFIKLAFAMGINWSTEIISWLVNWQTDNAYSKIWYFTDCVNALYGVFIFFIFVFKKKTWRLLKRRYYAFRGKVYLAHSMGGTTRPTNVSTTETTTVTSTANGARRSEDNILLHDRQ